MHPPIESVRPSVEEASYLWVSQPMGIPSAAEATYTYTHTYVWHAHARHVWPSFCMMSLNAPHLPYMHATNIGVHLSLSLVLLAFCFTHLTVIDAMSYDDVKA